MVSAEIVDIRYDKPHTEDGPNPPRGDDGNYRQTVTATSNCGSNTAMLEGWLFTSSCRTVTIKSLSYDDGNDQVTLVLYPVWDNPAPPEDVDCAGAKYHYRIQLTAQSTRLGEIRVVYQWPDKKNPSRFAIPSDC